ncbi:MAG TPA: type II toxin-antitoxin system VapC family toxin [Chloroflexia bacterium]|jgi:predicted nucleic acid-binding protein
MAMMEGRSVFLDTNVLVYATIHQSILHQEAQAAISDYKRKNVETWISRQVIREYLATLTRSNTFTSLGNPIPVATLAAEVQLFGNQYRIAEDNRVVTRELLDLITMIPTGGKQVHDANIVATMLAYGIRELLTHNTTDFARFAPFINVVPLSAQTK